MLEPELDSLWKIIFDGLHGSFNDIAFNTWIKPAKPIEFKNDTLVIEVPFQMVKEYWERNINETIIDLLEPAIGRRINIVIRSAADDNDEPSNQAAENTLNTEAEEQIPAASQKKASNNNFVHNNQLNSDYTFEKFVVGNGNKMAHAAALAVAEDPGRVYNPLFIYGGAGLGKTHLMQAIGHTILQRDPTAKVKYVSSEAFANDFINSIQLKNQSEFRDEYRNVDLLLVDDIQFLANKVGTQEEFFNTFETLFQNNKQIVLTADRLPNEIQNLQTRLVTRFKMGLPVDITPPDFETRIAILREKSQSLGLDLPDEALNYISGHFDSSVRDLEGALSRIKVFTSMTDAPITTSMVAEALRGLVGQGATKEITIPIIQNKVAKYFNVTVTDLKGKKRVKSIVMPRQIAMYLSRELTDASLPKIGQEFGGKDHTTVIHAHEKIQTELLTNKDLQNDIKEIKDQLQV
ncbi:chromosomal replication initiator protein DnaA [Ligilactobacillus sp. 110_WCHN]|uniref:chromosomal replication initiator protein DnaA n=1 Tax=Ligilactobacillus sp. 110_WCHN TaxID=3057125 RepID=UPI0026726935|nr:chromosomal replication initiator protein DnaA [Ligilactobacillus sp. 110_WCHN]MDO3393691.1 chromosomal replication initiator protein DnaA [Ligilactobacillus sp. 110_WCHN]